MDLHHQKVSFPQLRILHDPETYILIAEGLVLPCWLLLTELDRMTGAMALYWYAKVVELYGVTLYLASPSILIPRSSRGTTGSQVNTSLHLKPTPIANL